VVQNWVRPIKNGDFDILEGRVNQDGDWTFVKSYNGQGPAGWTHSWLYGGEMKGPVGQI